MTSLKYVKKQNKKQKKQMKRKTSCVIIEKNACTKTQEGCEELWQ